MHVSDTFLILLGVIAVAGIVAGTVLAVTGYSSAGPFAVASACVGVLGALATQAYQQAHQQHNGQQEDTP